MILTKPFDKNKLVEFNIDTGDVLDVFSADSIHEGVFEKIDNDNFAFYKLNNKLVLQINQCKWNILDANISIKYFHDFHENITFFSIDDKTSKYSTRYKSWWSDIPDFIPLDPELDEEEDFLGYIYSIWKYRVSP